MMQERLPPPILVKTWLLLLDSDDPDVRQRAAEMLTTALGSSEALIRYGQLHGVDGVARAVKLFGPAHRPQP